MNHGRACNAQNFCLQITGTHDQMLENSRKNNLLLDCVRDDILHSAVSGCFDELKVWNGVIVNVGKRPCESIFCMSSPTMFLSAPGSTRACHRVLHHCLEVLMQCSICQPLSSESCSPKGRSSTPSSCYLESFLGWGRGQADSNTVDPFKNPEHWLLQPSETPHIPQWMLEQN